MPAWRGGQIFFFSGVSDELGGRKSIQFLYIERETREWMNRSVVNLRKMCLDVGIIQQQIKEVGADMPVKLIEESYCYVTFPDK